MTGGVFGKPTGADVYIMGMAHAEYGALVTGMPKIRKNMFCMMKSQFGNKFL